MEPQKSQPIMSIIISIIITALLTGGIFYFWQKTQSDAKDQTIQTLQNQNQTLTDANNKLQASLQAKTQAETSATAAATTVTGATSETAVTSENQFDAGAVIDKETGLRANDYVLFNMVMSEVMPRICLDQQKKNLNPDNPVCILYDINNKGGNAVEILKKYRDSLHS